MNFLFPLANAISTFFLGQGFTRIIIFTNIVAQLLNIILDYLLIFGASPFFPSLGIVGAAIATALSQLFVCLVFIIAFIQKSNRHIYGTNQYHLKGKLFWNCIKVGIPRAIARLSLLAVWACATYIMMSKGDIHLLVLSIGTILVGTFLFINEGMSQGMITIASMLFGAKQWSLIWKLLRSALLFSIGTSLLLSIPLLFFPNLLLTLFFPTMPTDFPIVLIYKTCTWIWFLVLGNALNLISTSFLTASRDTFFHMATNCLSWLICYIPILLFIDLWDYSADTFWLIFAIEPFILSVVIFLRLRKERWKRL